MATMRGGLEFGEGEPVKLPPPPGSLPARVLQLTCPSRPEVVAGQRVRAGQALSEPEDGRSGCQVSPVEGTVRRIVPLGVPRRYVVVIEPEESRVPTSIAVAPPARQPHDSWLSSFRRTGPWGEYGVSPGLIEQLSATSGRPPDMVICLGLDQFPPYPVRSSLLASFADDAVLGTHILSDLVGAKQTLMLASRHPRVLARLRGACKSYRLRLEAVHNVYPLATPTLVAHMYGPTKARRLPHGANPGALGLVILSPWTAIRIARWFTLGRLDMVRPLLLAWPRARTPMTIAWAMPGQPLGSLDPALTGDASQLHGRVVVGHPMTGRALAVPYEPHDEATAGTSASATYAPSVPDDELLLSILSSAAQSEPEPCISCGWCVDVCPTRLNPWRLAQEGLTHPTRVDVADALRWCVQCGLCTHVCPSALPLAQALRQAARDAALGVAPALTTAETSTPADSVDQK